MIAIRILVVDDDPFIQKLIGIHLKKDGFTPVFAKDGVEALELIGEETLDLAIVDVMMPKLDGISLTKRLAMHGIPVLMLTAKTTLEDKEKGFLAGADDYMVKPFKITELVARVNALGRRMTRNTIVSDAHILKISDLRLDTDAKTAFRGDEAISLTS